MKILFVLHTLASGGAERVTSTLANHWADRGHDVAIATMGRGEDFFALDPRVTRHQFDLSRPSSSTGQALLGAWRRIVALRQLVASERPDVAIAMMASWNVELGLAAAGLPVRTIGSERIHPPRLPLGPVWERLRRHTYRLLDAVVAQTEPSRRWIEGHTSARAVRVIPNPCPPAERAEPACLEGLPRAAPVLLGVGRLVEQKRFDRLVDLVAQAPELSEWHLVIVGDGPLLPDLRRRATDAGIGHRAHFPGRSTMIGAWYARAQIFALSSDFEGFPNALLEAMAHGLPVVATDCETGPADLVEHGVNGLLVPTSEPQELRAAVSRIAADPALRKTMGAAARAACDRYSLEAVAAQWEALFPSSGTMR